MFNGHIWHSWAQIIFWYSTGNPPQYIIWHNSKNWGHLSGLIIAVILIILIIFIIFIINIDIIIFNIMIIAFNINYIIMMIRSGLETWQLAASTVWGSPEPVRVFTTLQRSIRWLWWWWWVLDWFGKTTLKTTKVAKKGWERKRDWDKIMKMTKLRANGATLTRSSSRRIATLSRFHHHQNHHPDQINNTLLHMIMIIIIMIIWS